MATKIKKLKHADLQIIYYILAAHNQLDQKAQCFKDKLWFQFKISL